MPSSCNMCVRAVAEAQSRSGPRWAAARTSLWRGGAGEIAARRSATHTKRKLSPFKVPCYSSNFTELPPHIRTKTLPKRAEIGRCGGEQGRATFDASPLTRYRAALPATPSSHTAAPTAQRAEVPHTRALTHTTPPGKAAGTRAGATRRMSSSATCRRRRPTPRAQLFAILTLTRVRTWLCALQSRRAGACIGAHNRARSPPAGQGRSKEGAKKGVRAEGSDPAERTLL
jgi:hypothetical protein